MTYPWPEKYIGDFALVRGGKRLPTDKSLLSYRTLYPYIRLVDITHNRISQENMMYLDNETQAKMARYIVNTNDVCLAIVGHTIGMVFFIDDKWNNANLTENAARITCLNSADPKYLFYYLLSSFGYNKIKAHAVGSAQGKLPLFNIKNIKVPLPPLPEQRAIASILGALDDKIELNRKMNETSEAMARAIFKSWFVDFDPIPGIGPHSEWQDSPMGKIPKKWRAGTLGEMCEIVMGQSPPGETYNEIGEGLPFYQGIRDFGFRTPSKRVYCTAPTRFAEEGDVLLSVRAPVGSLNIASESCAIGRGVAALRIKGQHYGFLYYLMKETQWEWAKFEAEGTVFGAASKTDVQNFSAIFPPSQIISRFNEVVFPFDQKIMNNEIQSLTVASIRDTLLPKLFSGEIRIKDSDKLAEAAL